MRIYNTAGREADNELTEILGAEGRLYKSDLLEKHSPQAIRIASSYEEWLAWWTVDAYVRPGFSVDDNVVLIPCFISVITHTHVEDLLQNLQLKSQSNASAGELHYSSFHLLERKLPKEQFRSIIDECADFFNAFKTLDTDTINAKDKENLLEMLFKVPINPLDMLTPEKKKAYLTAALETFAFARQINLCNSDDIDGEFLQLVFGCERIVEAYSYRDYQKKVPKCTIVHRQKKPTTALGVMRLLLMHFLAFDIAILTVSANGGIEHLMPESFYDRHRYQALSSSLSESKAKKALKFSAIAGAAAAIVSGLMWLL